MPLNIFSNAQTMCYKLFKYILPIIFAFQQIKRIGLANVRCHLGNCYVHYLKNVRIDVLVQMIFLLQVYKYFICEYFFQIKTNVRTLTNVVSNMSYVFTDQSHKIDKHTQNNSSVVSPTNCLSVFDHFVGLAFYCLILRK